VRSLGCLLTVLVLFSIFPRSARGQAEASPDTTRRIPNPRTALLLGLIPGGGQIYNRDWLKALLVVGAEGYYIYQFQHYQQLCDGYDEQDGIDGLGGNPYLEPRNRSAWRALFVYLLGMMDAYVDAHLSTFPPDTTYQTQPPPEQPTEKGP